MLADARVQELQILKFKKERTHAVAKTKYFEDES